MAKRQFHLTEEEIMAFRQAEGQTRDVSELKRLQAVRQRECVELVAHTRRVEVRREGLDFAVGAPHRDGDAAAGEDVLQPNAERDARIEAEGLYTDPIQGIAPLDEEDEPKVEPVSPDFDL